MTPCKYAEGAEGERECTCYGKVECPYQAVEYNYIDFTTGHKEINAVKCTEESEDKE